MATLTTFDRDRAELIQRYIFKAVGERDLEIPGLSAAAHDALFRMEEPERTCKDHIGGCVLAVSIRNILFERPDVYSDEAINAITNPLLTNRTFSAIVYDLDRTIQQPKNDKARKKQADALELHFGLINSVEGFKTAEAGVLMLFEPLIDAAMTGFLSIPRRMADGRLDISGPYELHPWPRRDEAEGRLAKRARCDPGPSKAPLGNSTNI